MKRQWDRFTSLWEEPYGPFCVGAFLFAVLSIAFSNISFVTCLFLLLAGVPWIIKFVQEIELPGGAKIKFSEMLQDVSERAKEAGVIQDGIPDREKLSYLKAISDPNLALAGLRIEIEKRLTKLCELAGIEISRGLPIRHACNILQSNGHLSAREMALLSDLMPLLNQAVHGKKVDQESVNWVMTDGSKILEVLDDKISAFKPPQ